MESLPENWLTEGLIDFEYKKYLLLAYLDHVKSSFQKIELYPALAELVAHYRNLIALKENKALIFDQFPRQLSLDNLHNLELNYKKIIEDDAVMQEIESITEFSIPQLKNSLDEGSVIYDYVESHCEISPVGLTSLYANEGYLFITQPPERQTDVYRYQITIFDGSNEQLRAIHTNFVFSAERSIANTYEQIKLDLIREYRYWPNPATYLVLSKLKLPMTQTLVPVAKRLLVKQISKAA